MLFDKILYIVHTNTMLPIKKLLKRLSGRERGFTLIEMLVVIAIISILIGIGINTFTIAQQKARDVRRKADLRSIQVALELYKQDTGVYPVLSAANCSGGNGYHYADVVLGCAALSPSFSSYLPSIPKDPLGNSCPSGWFYQDTSCHGYFYASPISGCGYILAVSLENKNDPDGNKALSCGWGVPQVANAVQNGVSYYSVGN